MEELTSKESGPPRRQPRFFDFVVTRLEAIGLSLIAGFFVCAVLVGLFGLLARDVFLTARAGPLDRDVTLYVRGLQTPARDYFALTATFFGSHLFILPATLVVAGILRWKHHPVSALLFLGSVGGGFILNALLKITFHRARPDLWPALVSEHSYSFPSGHATMSTVFYGGLAAVVFHLSDRTGPRIGALAFALLAILTIMGTRVYLGVHWATDVTAGFLVGLFWVIVSAVATEFVYRRVPAARPVRRSRRPKG
ncbi:MAG TPA: phosphatase PAP2 family protein [Thermoanaerobaculia bacterium]|jgi:undecaprenyl-diphosphatase